MYHDRRAISVRQISPSAILTGSRSAPHLRHCRDVESWALIVPALLPTLFASIKSVCGRRMPMDDSRHKPQSRAPLLTHLYRRLRYQGTAQWITLILCVACISLWTLTTPLNPYYYREDSALARLQPPAEGENAGAQNDLVQSDGDKSAQVKSSEIDFDLLEEVPPEFIDSSFWNGVDWDEPLEMPDKIAGAVFEMNVETGEEDIELKYPSGEMHVITVAYRESVPKKKPKMDILLLHGSRFNSETWVTVDTTKTLAAMGYRATAIDLPGFGNTAGSVLFGEKAVMLIENFCLAHGMKNPVIVAPSMSGGYAMPYLMSRPFNVTGFIALGPTSTERYKPEEYVQLKVPMLVVYGSKDATYGRQVAEHLTAAPNSEVKIIQDAHHAVYLDQPDEWHRIAYIFLTRLEAWMDKNNQTNVTTTPHPPVVTHNAAETLAPEVTLAPLNVPPIKSAAEAEAEAEEHAQKLIDQAEQYVQPGATLEQAKLSNNLPPAPPKSYIRTTPMMQLVMIDGVPVRDQSPENINRLLSQASGDSAGGDSEARLAEQDRATGLKQVLPQPNGIADPSAQTGAGSPNSQGFQMTNNAQTSNAVFPNNQVQAVPKSSLSVTQNTLSNDFQSGAYMQNGGASQVQNAALQMVNAGALPQNPPQSFQNQPPVLPPGQQTAFQQKSQSVSSNFPDAFGMPPGIPAPNPVASPPVMSQQQPSLNQVDSLTQTVRPPVPGNYPVNGFPAPNPAESSIRIATPATVPGGIDALEFQKLNKIAADRSALLPVTIVPDVRPVPPFDETKFIPEDNAHGSYYPPGVQPPANVRFAEQQPAGLTLNDQNRERPEEGQRPGVNDEISVQQPKLGSPSQSFG